MIKDIMVHLDGSPEDEIRLEHGQALASARRAHLIGLFTNQLPDLTIAMPMDGGAAAIQVLTELQDQALKDGDLTAKRLTERLSSLQVAGELRRLDGTFGVLYGRVADEARCADLFITTRPYGDTKLGVWPDLVEAVLFGSGRALLLVPPGRHRQGPIQTVLVAWNSSRESARALREGLEFIEQAVRTVVLFVDPPSDTETVTEVVAHLARHGVVAEVVTSESRDRHVADVIIDEARRISADLVIMGAYGHTRLREQVFGGATRDMLTASESPILVAH
ncbi:nucleotide-binding universal stress UspA family protein [Microvirga lupini]|uniref:Nucleotide-binding universal stress UspA family protein n=1 Tax=Microvirga lupini TaxID=420324 RepID=A0A7W4VM15_9HYPH|nr:universal stress protein [Microvirga lupini]MBB3019601.1 nucleotide-binding universal stress UspA family protein [Microvirga lupini]